MADLKRVSKIGQKYKDIVYGFIHKAQSLYPNEPYFNIADLIKHLCLLYFHQIMDTKILTDQEQQIFMNLLEKNKKNFDNYIWNLIWRGSEDGLNRASFASKCFDEANLMVFIHTAGDNVFGGFTSKGWKTGNDLFTADSKAFIFGIRSSKQYKPIISNIKKEEAHNAIYSCQGYYILFGQGFTINVSEAGYVHHNDQISYEKLPEYIHLTAGNPSEEVVDIEVFQLNQ